MSPPEPICTVFWSAQARMTGSVDLHGKNLLVNYQAFHECAKPEGHASSLHVCECGASERYTVSPS